MLGELPLDDVQRGLAGVVVDRGALRHGAAPDRTAEMRTASSTAVLRAFEPRRRPRGIEDGPRDSSSPRFNISPNRERYPGGASDRTRPVSLPQQRDGFLTPPAFAEVRRGIAFRGVPRCHTSTKRAVACETTHVSSARTTCTDFNTLAAIHDPRLLNEPRTVTAIPRRGDGILTPPVLAAGEASLFLAVIRALRRRMRNDDYWVRM